MVIVFKSAQSKYKLSKLVIGMTLENKNKCLMMFNEVEKYIFGSLRQILRVLKDPLSEPTKSILNVCCGTIKKKKKQG